MRLAADVSSDFLKAGQLTSEAGGEFVQDSTLKGAGRQAEATLTLRVAVDRLHVVLNELRKLGKVNSENVAGEDVTTQIVDLEARLRNDRRVEEELLKLFDQRQNAPLKEILELRDKLSQVRQAIEQITAQRERLGRLVSLATILIILRPADAPQSAAPTLFNHFATSISAAFHNGLIFLTDSFAGLIALLIGGLLWWLLAALVAAFVWRAIRKSNKPVL